MLDPCTTTVTHDSSLTRRRSCVMGRCNAADLPNLKRGWKWLGPCSRWWMRAHRRIDAALDDERLWLATYDETLTLGGFANSASSSS